jgi:hypothetical protein
LFKLVIRLLQTFALLKKRFDLRFETGKQFFHGHSHPTNSKEIILPSLRVKLQSPGRERMDFARE